MAQHMNPKNGVLYVRGISPANKLWLKSAARADGRTIPAFLDRVLTFLREKKMALK